METGPATQKILMHQEGYVIVHDVTRAAPVSSRLILQSAYTYNRREEDILRRKYFAFVHLTSFVYSLG